MSKQFYISTNFGSERLLMIDRINAIIDDYTAQGYRLTVRQLYYQLVAADVIENTMQSYKRITGLVNDAKLAGLMDWDAIEDRTREFVRRERYDGGREILDIAAKAFHMDMWKGQSARVFVIVEKEALAGVLEVPCRDLDVPLLAARGYPSGTVLREFCQSDVLPAVEQEQDIVILHLGDHDPSGLDMTRDLTDRIATFAEGHDVTLRRIALNGDQIKSQKPPPNPAKSTDSRFRGYQAEYGNSSWELDALKPEFLDRLVRTNVQRYIDGALWKERTGEVENIRAQIERAAETFEGE